MLKKCDYFEWSIPFELKMDHDQKSQESLKFRKNPCQEMKKTLCITEENKQTNKQNTKEHKDTENLGVVGWKIDQLSSNKIVLLLQ